MSLLDKPANALDPVDFERLEATLLAEFSPPLRAEEVQRHLIECIETFQVATVRNYLSVLIERAARQQLLSLLSERHEMTKLPLPN
jgi:hypothetical protein